jgi:bacteriocin-like protein
MASPLQSTHRMSIKTISIESLAQVTGGAGFFNNLGSGFLAGMGAGLPVRDPAGQTTSQGGGSLPAPFQQQQLSGGGAPTSEN